MKLTPDKTTDYKRLLAHPLSLAFPECDAEVFNGLIQSMKNHGFDERHPVIIFQNKILDGRNRLKAAKTAGVVPSMAQFTGDIREAVEFVLSENMHRRHLDQVQKALITDALMKFIPHEIGVNNTTGEKIYLKPGTTEKAVANLGVTSIHATRRAKVIGVDPKLAKDVVDGKIKSSAATKIIRERQRQTQDQTPEAKRNDMIEDGERLFNELMSSIKDAKRAIMTAAGGKWGRHIHRVQMDTDFDNIIRQLKFCTPYKPCPIASDCDATCKLCGGTHWISKGQFDSLPKSLQK